MFSHFSLKFVSKVEKSLWEISTIGSIEVGTNCQKFDSNNFYIPNCYRNNLFEEHSCKVRQLVTTRVQFDNFVEAIESDLFKRSS